MKKFITAVLVAGLLVTSGWAAARAENALADKHQNKTLLGVYDIGTGQLIPINIRVNDGGDQIVDGDTNTFTVAGEVLDDILAEAVTIKSNTTDILAEAVTIKSNTTDILAEAVTIKSNTTDILAEAVTIKTNTGTIAGDTTSIDGKMVDGTDIGDVTVNNAVGAAGVFVQGQEADGAAVAGNGVRVAGKDGSGNGQDVSVDTDGDLQVDVLTSALPAGAATEAKQDAQILQLGVIEGNGTTLNVTAAAIDAGVTAVNSELDSQSLQLGVIEGNGTTLNVTAAAIDAGVTAINTELDSQSLQLGVIEGNGTTAVARLDSMLLELGAIEGNGNTLLAEVESQSLQLGVIEGNGTTLNVTAAAIDAGVTAINTELDSQSLQLGVIEGNGTTLNVTASSIDAGVTAINSELDGQSLQLGVIEGNGTTGTAAVVSIDGKMVDGTDIGDVTVNNAAAGAAVNIQDGGNTITVDGTVAVSGAGAVTITSPLDGGAEAGAVLVTVANNSTGLLSVDDNGGSLTVDGGVSVTNATGAGGVFIQGQQADGAAAVGGSVRIAGRDTGNNAQDINTDTGGRVVVVGGGADGSGVVGLPIRIGGKDGSGNTQDILTDTDGNLQVDVAAELPAGTQKIGEVDIDDISSGTQTNDVKVTMDTEVVATTNAIVDGWDATSGAAISTDGPQVMAHYDSTKPTAVADGQAVQVLADQYGRPLSGVEPERNQVTITSADATGATQVIAKTVDKKIYILSLLVSTDTAMNIQFQDDTGPTVLIEQLYFAANGGVPINFPPEAPLVVNTNEDFDVIASVAGNISVTATYYLAP